MSQTRNSYSDLAFGAFLLACMGTGLYNGSRVGEKTNKSEPLTYGDLATLFGPAALSLLIIILTRSSCFQAEPQQAPQEEPRTQRRHKKNSNKPTGPETKDESLSQVVNARLEKIFKQEGKITSLQADISKLENEITEGLKGKRSTPEYGKFLEIASELKKSEGSVKQFRECLAKQIHQDSDLLKMEMDSQKCFTELNRIKAKMAALKTKIESLDPKFEAKKSPLVAQSAIRQIKPTKVQVQLTGQEPRP